MYSDTCINRSCSKVDNFLKRTDTFDLACFLYTSLSHISTAETAKRALLRTDNFFSPQIRKATCLTRTQRKFLGILRNRELNWTFLSIFSKKLFLYFKAIMILSDFILQFWRSTILLSRTLYLFFPSFPLQPSNSYFASLKAISDRHL